MRGTVPDVAEINRTEETLRRSEQRLALLTETASQLLASGSPQAVVNSLCQKVMAFLDCDAFFNFLVDEKAGRLRLNTCGGIPDEEAEKIHWLDYGVAVCGCAARDGCRIVAEDIQNVYDPRTELVKSYGIQAYACHPLMVQGKVLGSLSFGTRSRTHFNDEELALMKAVADQVAIAIDRKYSDEAREAQERLRYLASHLIKAQEEERKRISWELHEEFGQALMALKFQLRALQRSLPEGLAETRADSEKILTYLNELVEMMRRITYNLRPLALDLGLNEALNHLFKDFLEPQNLKLSKDLDDLQDLFSPTEQTTIYRIFQEALTNIARHARATNVFVNVKREAGHVFFQVADNGIGFDPEEIRSRDIVTGGMGLAAVDERLRMLGGSLDIWSQPGRGTRVTFRVPFS